MPLVRCGATELAPMGTGPLRAFLVLRVPLGGRGRHGDQRQLLQVTDGRSSSPGRGVPPRERPVRSVAELRGVRAGRRTVGGQPAVVPVGACGMFCASLPVCSLSMTVGVVLSTLKVTASPTARDEMVASPFLSTSLAALTV